MKHDLKILIREKPSVKKQRTLSQRLRSLLGRGGVTIVLPGGRLERLHIRNLTKEGEPVEK